MGRRLCYAPKPNRPPNPLLRTTALWRISPADRFLAARMVLSTVRCHLEEARTLASSVTEAAQQAFDAKSVTGCRFALAVAIALNLP
jgi:hypothetical protein